MNAIAILIFGLGLGCSDTELGVYNTAPTVEILSPEDGAVFAEGELIALEGIAKDGERFTKIKEYTCLN